MRYSLGLLVLLVLLGHAIKSHELSFVNALDRLIYDTKVKASMPQDIDERIVILDIDEKSLAEIGRWPWQRDRMATLVNKLFDHYRISLLGFDIVLAEPDVSSGLKILEKLGQDELKDNQQYLATMKRLSPLLDYDKLFSASLRNRPVVLGYYLAQEGVSSGALPAPVLRAGAFSGRKIRITSWLSHGGNLREFQEAATRGGHFNPIVDDDGSVRRVPLLAEYKGAYYEAFSLAMVRALFDGATVVPEFGEAQAAGSGYAAIEWLGLQTPRGNAHRISVDENVAAWVPYRGYQNSYRYYSIADVLANRIQPQLLNGKIVIVGTTAPGLRDFRTTPVSQLYPGMEVHANLISGMLDASIKTKPPYADAIESVLLLMTGGVMIFLFPWRSPLRATLATLTMMALVIGVNLAFWQAANWVLPIAAGLLLVSALFVLNMSYGYFVESRAKRQMAERFGQYVPPELVQKMSLNPGSYSMQSRKAELTVLFSDVRGFTSLSEGMAPEQLAQLMNEYLTAMTLVIRKHRGTLDKYIGDAIVAFWGAPMDDPQHARNAVLAALEMQKSLQDLNDTFRTRGWPEIRIGVGINTGAMIVGDMGSSIRLAYTVMGDAVNLGARLEGKTKDYGVSVMVGESTRTSVNEVQFRELDRIQVVGKETSVTIFEPLGATGELSESTADELALWQKALFCYRQQDWDQAEAVLASLVRTQPASRLYLLYQERIAAFRTNPPGAGWNGVTIFDTK
ncbi:MAG: adenylate/guanylate cyclase domain-containing protein [Pseudomonadota bacterium]